MPHPNGSNSAVRVSLAALAALLLLGGCSQGGQNPPDGGSTPTLTVGGTVAGLLGGGLVLQNNGGDDLAVGENGAFAFAGKLQSGQTYAVTVKQQPTSPSQTCEVSGGGGTLAQSDITSVTVNCSTHGYSIGGTASGLVGSGLVLQNNGRDDLSIAANGAFTFAAQVASGQGFAVTVRTQPGAPSQTCTVSGGTGTVGGGNVTSVAVNCDSNSFTVGGTVTGLSGSGLVLRNKGGDDLSVTANGTFAFATPIASGGTYSVTVANQPSSPSQTCAVTGGTGTLTSGNVTDVVVTCGTESFTVGGTVSGLSGSGLVLQNSGAETLSVSANGTFTFSTPLASGFTYSVTVLTQPSSPSQTCAVSSGSGTVPSSSVTNVTVACTTNTYSVGGTVSGLSGAGLVLQNGGGDNLSVSVNGAFTFTTPIISGGTYAVTVLSQPAPPTQSCLVSNGSGAVTSSAVTTVTVSCTCTGGYFGPNCTACQCQNGASCNDGSAGTGACTCASGYYGYTCSGACGCLNGASCSDGATGSGACTCTSGYFGPTCSSACGCQNGASCDDGAAGTGACTCASGYFGPTCSSACACQNGASCDDGATGTGACTCTSGHFGPTCSGACACQNGASCEEGAEGSGACTCTSGHFGPTCSGACACQNGASCDEGAEGSGACTCASGYYGSTCSGACACQNGASCDDGEAGSGACTCVSGFYGPTCSGVCNCPIGSSCDDGDTGTGACN